MVAEIGTGDSKSDDGNTHAFNPFDDRVIQEWEVKPSESDGDHGFGVVPTAEWDSNVSRLRALGPLVFPVSPLTAASPATPPERPITPPKSPTTPSSQDTPPDDFLRLRNEPQPAPRSSSTILSEAEQPRSPQTPVEPQRFVPTINGKPLYDKPDPQGFRYISAADASGAVSKPVGNTEVMDFGGAGRGGLPPRPPVGGDNSESEPARRPRRRNPRRVAGAVLGLIAAGGLGIGAVKVFGVDHEPDRAVPSVDHTTASPSPNAKRGTITPSVTAKPTAHKSVFMSPTHNHSASASPTSDPETQSPTDEPTIITPSSAPATESQPAQSQPSESQPPDSQPTPSVTSDMPTQQPTQESTQPEAPTSSVVPTDTASAEQSSSMQPPETDNTTQPGQPPETSESAQPPADDPSTPSSEPSESAEASQTPEQPLASDTPSLPQQSQSPEPTMSPTPTAAETTPADCKWWDELIGKCSQRQQSPPPVVGQPAPSMPAEPSPSMGNEQNGQPAEQDNNPFNPANQGWFNGKHKPRWMPKF